MNEYTPVNRSATPSPILGRLFVLAIAFFALVPCGRAQDDSTETHHHWRWFSWHRNPTMSVGYGITNTTMDGFVQPMRELPSLTLKLGGTRIEHVTDEPNILQYRFHYGFVSNASTELGGSGGAGEFNADVWRFGGGWDKGFGYGFSDSPDGAALFLTHAQSMTWTKVRPRSAFIVAGDSSLYSIFEGDLRFGTTMEAGVKVRVVPLVTIEGGFERTLMFRRHQVWKWLGSVCLEGIGQWGIDRFVEQVEESSPAAVPVVHFVLKNAFTYAVYQLRKQMMNYPFDSESSMVFDSFRVSLTVVF